MKQVLLPYDEHQRLINAQEIYLKRIEEDEIRHKKEIQELEERSKKIVIHVHDYSFRNVYSVEYHCQNIDEVKDYMETKFNYFRSLGNKVESLKKDENSLIEKNYKLHDKINDLETQLKNKKFSGFLSFLNKYLPK